MKLCQRWSLTAASEGTLEGNHQKRRDATRRAVAIAAQLRSGWFE
jgi:hypothetical protein